MRANEILSTEHLDRILTKLCEMIIDGQERDKDTYGCVAACLLDPNGVEVCRINLPDSEGKRIHAERMAIDAYVSENGPVPLGSTVITTLSPCSETMDDRHGESCSRLLHGVGIKRVYCGYIDPTQDTSSARFRIIETGNKKLKNLCQKIAGIFLTEDSKTNMMAKIESTGKIVRIIRKQHEVKFSDQKDWLLVDVDPALGNRGLGLKWIPANTRFSWVRPYLEKIDESVDAKKIVSYIKKMQGDGHFYMDNLVTRYPSWHLIQIPLSKLTINPDPEKMNPLGTNINVDLDYMQDITPHDIANRPIVVDPSGWIIDGNHRATRAEELGMKSIPAYVPVKQGVDEGLEKFNTDLMKPGFRWSEEINGITYLVRTQWDNMPEVIARVNNREVGRATFIDHHTRSGLESVSTYVSPKWQGHGIAKNMYAVIRMLGANIQPSATQTAMGKDMWAKWKKGGDTKHLTSMNAKMDQQGVAEGLTGLSIQQLATISDEALDNAYHYGRSQPGNTFGWQANLKSAAYAKQMIDKGVTDIEAISDAIHKGWNVTAQAFVKNPDQFSDTEKLKAAGKLEAKLQQRAQLMKQNYAQLPEEEKEKDRVVARALLRAITGQQGVAENFADGKGPGRPGDSQRHGIPKHATMAELEKASHAKGRKGQLARWQLNMRRGHKK